MLKKSKVNLIFLCNATFKDSKLYKGKNAQRLIDDMKRMDTSLPLISMELEANKACRQNNSMILCNENCDPKLGGNIDIY